MTEHTKRDIMEHLADAIADNSDIEGQAEHLINALGLTVAPAKPEPGTWHLANLGGAPRPAFVEDTGDLCVIEPDGDHIFYYSYASDWPDLAPAKVVEESTWEALVQDRDVWKAAAQAEADEVDSLAAEPVGLSEEEVARIHNNNVDSTVLFNEMPDVVQAEQADIIRAAYVAGAKHGRGRVEVTREQVEDATRKAMRNGVLGTSETTVQEITDAVMTLLGGGDRG